MRACFERRNCLAIVIICALIDFSPLQPQDATEQGAAEQDAAEQGAAEQGAAEKVEAVGSRTITVYSTQEILKDSRRRAELFDFCKEHDVGTIWMQLLYDIRSQPIGNGAAYCTIHEPRELRRLLREAHAASIKVHALDGFPEFSLSEYHAVPISICEALIAFNRQSEAEERFDGVHFDNRPQDLVGWQSSELRPQITTEFLLLNKKCKAIAEQQDGFEFGIEIPGQWHPEDPFSQLFAFDGKSMTLARQCARSTDNIGISNIVYGTGERVGNAKVFLKDIPKGGPKVSLGVETCVEEETRIWFAIGRPRSDFEYSASEEDSVMTWRSRFNGIRLQTFDDGKNVHVGFEIPEGDAHQSPEFQEMLSALTQSFGAGSIPPAELEATAQRALKKISATENFDGARLLALKIDGFDQEPLGVFVKFKPSTDETLGRYDSKLFSKKLSELESEFEKQPAFGGMVIHSFETARELP